VGKWSVRKVFTENIIKVFFYIIIYSVITSVIKRQAMKKVIHFQSSPKECEISFCQFIGFWRKL
jgi:hypothetical protein